MKAPYILVAVTMAALGGVVAFAQPLQSQRTEQASAEPQRGQNALERLRSYVMDRNGTERAFQNEYWDHHEPGIYVEARTGEPLFASTDKFDSGSGWPSFTRPIDIAALTSRNDGTLGMERTEVRSAQGDAHLGHVFDDGPSERGGKRYCINSCAIRFIPRARMEAEGYGQFVDLIDHPERYPAE